MVNINWTNESQFWLKEIFDYIAEDNKKMAQKVISEIYEKVQILKTFPNIGYKYFENSEEDIRILLYGHYRIAYFVKDDKNIDILGVFHGSLDIQRYL